MSGFRDELLSVLKANGLVHISRGIYDDYVAADNLERFPAVASHLKDKFGLSSAQLREYVSYYSRARNMSDLELPDMHLMRVASQCMLCLDPDYLPLLIHTAEGTEFRQEVASALSSQNIDTYQKARFKSPHHLKLYSASLMAAFMRPHGGVKRIETAKAELSAVLVRYLEKGGTKRGRNYKRFCDGLKQIEVVGFIDALSDALVQLFQEPGGGKLLAEIEQSFNNFKLQAPGAFPDRYLEPYKLRVELVTFRDSAGGFGGVRRQTQLKSMPLSFQSAHVDPRFFNEPGALVAAAGAGVAQTPFGDAAMGGASGEAVPTTGPAPGVGDVD